MGGSLSALAKKANVQVALDKALYTAGDVVRGYVQIVILADDVDIPALAVNFAGSANTQVHYMETVGSGDNQHKVSRTACQTVNLANFDTRIAPLDPSIAKAKAGARIQCPFEFVVPLDAPTSMPALHIGQDVASISYTVGVLATFPGKLYGSTTSAVHSVEVDIVAPTPAALQAQRIEEAVKVTRCCCIPAGHMRIAARSDRVLFKSGDVASVMYELSNDTKQVVSFVDVALKMHVSFSANGHSSGSSSIVVSTKEAGVDPGVSFGFSVGAASGNASKVADDATITATLGARSAVLTVPPGLRYFTTHSPTISVNFSFAVKVG